MKRLPIVLLAAAALSLTACTGLQGSEPHDDGSADSTSASGDEFCEAMAHLIVLLEPTELIESDRDAEDVRGGGGLVRAGG